MPSDRDQSYNDFFRSSEFYAIGRRADHAGHEIKYVACVPLSRYKDVEPTSPHCHVDTESRIPWLVSVPKGGENVSHDLRARRSEVMRRRWAAFRDAGGVGS